MTDKSLTVGEGPINGKPPVDSSARLYLQEYRVAQVLEAFVTDLVTERPQNVLRYMARWAATAEKLLSPGREEGLRNPTNNEQAEEAGSPKAVVGSVGSPRNSRPSHTTGADEDATKAVENHLRLQALAVRQSWDSLSSQLDGFAATFFTVLTTQHRALTRSLLKDADYVALGGAFTRMLDGVIRGTISDVELKHVAVEHGVSLNLEVRHYHYFITAALSALSIHLKEDFSPVSDAWRLVLTEITEVVRHAIENEVKLEDGDRDDSVAQDSEKAVNLLQDSWESIADRKIAVGQKFFELLTLQHPSLKRTVLKGVDLGDAAEKLTELLDGIVRAQVADDYIESLAQQFGAKHGLDPDKHAPYFITTMLTVLKINLGDRFPVVAEPWRLVLTKVTQAVERGMSGGSGMEERGMSVDLAETARDNLFDKHQEADAEGPPNVLADCWRSIEPRADFARTFFNILVTQHPSLKRGLLKDVDLDSLATKHFLPLLDGYIFGALGDQEIAAAAVEFGADKKLQPRYFDYFITCFLTTMSLSISKDDYTHLAEPWRMKVTHLAQLVERSLEEHIPLADRRLSSSNNVAAR